MRKSLIALVLLSGIATLPAPAFAQGQPEVGKRVDKLEREMRAVQRKVFGTTNVLEPEIAPPATPGAAPGTPATTPLNDLTARVDALEAQLANLTGQVEQVNFKTTQLEKELARIAALETRLKALESAPPPAAMPTPAQGGSEEPATAADPDRIARLTAVPRPSTGDAAEDQYSYGFRLWEAKLYPEAQAELKKVVEQHAAHRRASYAQNLLGRAYLDEGKPALATVAFYDNYEKMPKGERAPDSLYYLGQALIQLKKPADACKVYDELESVYGATLSPGLKTQVADARKKAKCSA